MPAITSLVSHLPWYDGSHCAGGKTARHPRGGAASAGDVPVSYAVMIRSPCRAAPSFGERGSALKPSLSQRALRGISTPKSPVAKAFGQRGDYYRPLTAGLDPAQGR